MTELTELMINAMHEFKNKGKVIYADSKMYNYYVTVYTSDSLKELKKVLLRRKIQHRFRPIYVTDSKGYTKVIGYDVYVLR